MPATVYKQMLDVMAGRGGPYAGLDIPEFYALAEALFTPQQAEINNALTRVPATAADIAGRIQKDEARTAALLNDMADQGLCFTTVTDGIRYYQGVPFMPGIFEYQFLPGRSSEREKKIAALIHIYKKAFTAAKPPAAITFPVTRVIPVDRKISAGNTIHTYDQVQTYIDRYDTICVGTCFCRQAARLRGESVHDMPMEVCFWFGKTGEFALERLGGRRLTRQEARKLLDETEAAGLIHMSRNTSDEIDFLCNCDRWHCEVVTEVLKQPRPGWVFNSGFQPVFDPGRCAACETCIGRCPPAALKMGEQNVPKVDGERCFGCAVCASGCPQDAIEMQTRPGWQPPPGTVKDLVAALKKEAAARQA
ncbi:MAG: 4Fe-4S dicluster domain-containing protein [Thermodesulfobacteriota bacterium]